MRYFIVTVLACACAFAQPIIDSPKAKGAVDFSTATTTKPNKVGSADPATCSVGETFFNTTSSTAKNCTATNTWTAVGTGATLPTMTGNANKVLSNNGTSASWVTPAGGPTGLITVDISSSPFTIDVVPSGFLPLGWAWTGYHNFSGGTVRLPESAFASLPTASSNTGKVFALTDSVAATACSTSAVACRSNGTSWIAVGAAGTTNRIVPQELRFASAYSGSATNSGGWSMIGSFTAPGGFVGIGDGANLNIGALKFSDAVTSHTYNMVSIPQGFVSLGSRLNWTHTASSTGNADWRMSYMCIAAGTQYNAAPTWTEVSFSNTGAAASVTAGIVSTISSVVTSGGNCVGGNTMLLRFSKYTGDTFSTDPVAIGLVLDWTVNQ